MWEDNPATAKIGISTTPQLKTANLNTVFVQAASKANRKDKSKVKCKENPAARKIDMMILTIKVSLTNLYAKIEDYKPNMSAIFTANRKNKM